MKVLVVDADGLWVQACRRAAAAAGHVLTLCGTLPARGHAEAVYAEAVLLAWPGPRDTVAWLRQLRQQAPGLPVLALFEPGDEAAVGAAMDAGVDEGLLRPVRPEELLLRLGQLQARHQPGAPAGLGLGDVQLDLAGLHATRAGLPVALTAAEWRIVGLLAARRGAYVSGAAVAAVLPQRGPLPGPAVPDGADAGDGGNRVAVHIANLRRKLGAACIESRRELGYRLAG